MCGLCGLWGETAHWTSVASRSLAAVARSGERAPMRARALQQASIDRVARTVGVTVRDWNGTSWVVAGAFGASTIVGSLPEVWRAAEALSGKRIDPLAAPAIEAAALRRAGGAHGRA